MFGGNMECQRCASTRILSAFGHCVDSFSARLDGKKYDGYVPSKLGIGGSDDIQIKVCMNCGQLQGTWPNSNKLPEGDEND